MMELEELFDEVRSLELKVKAMSQETKEVKAKLAETRNGAYGDVAKSLNKAAKILDSSDVKLFDGFTVLQAVRVDLQRQMEKDKDNGPDLFPPIKHGEVR